MKKDEILNMPAGREMDALIAKHVFGFLEMQLADAPCPYCASEMHFCGSRSWCSVCSKWRYSPYADYSTKKDVAWRVVEKMIDNGYCPNLVYDDNGHWALSFEAIHEIPMIEESEDFWVSVFVKNELWCDTIPLAICRSTLLSVMEFES